MKYKIEDINIGDSVYFENKYISNYDLYWNVISIKDGFLQLEVDEMGHKDMIFVEIKDIKIVIKSI